MSQMILPALLGLLASFALCLLLTPKQRSFFSLPKASYAFHIGGFFALLTFEMILFRRPWFAVGNVLALHALVIVVNNAKYHSMREPFLVHDFEYFTDAIKHPRLYLPFFGVGKAIAATIGFIAVLGLGIYWETPLYDQPGVTLTDTYFTIVALFVAAAISIRVGMRYQVKGLSLNPETDYQRLGFVGFLWHYGLLHICTKTTTERAEWAHSIESPVHSQHLPNLVVVQSESFFDPRAEYPNLLDPSILSHFDQTCHEAYGYGALTVPAWGANTIRTESAFLTGHAAKQFGVHQFSPYRHLMKSPKTTLAHALKALGYRTVCVHPYPASFYLRDQLYPKMGFDEFIDITAFTEADKVGQYTGDVPLTEKVLTLLEPSDAPVFVFVITMENHGPLHLEKPDVEDQNAFYVDTQPAECDDLTVYAKHLQNADRMIEMLTTSLSHSDRGGVLAWYGDHVPIMADVYRTLGAPSGETRYFLWSDQCEIKRPEANVPSDVSELAPQILTLVSERYHAAS
jgi:hypothetical protein